jgi:hypothetical protein
MANNRELSQLASFIVVDDTTRNIGIATTATPSVGIGTLNPHAKLQVVGDTILGEVKVTSTGIVTSSNPGISTVVYYGDGSKLFGVSAFNVIPQDLGPDPVYPTLANNVGVTSVGISSTGFVFIPSTNSLGIGTTAPTANLQVVGNTVLGNVKVTSAGIVTSSNPGVSTVVYYGDGSNLFGVSAFAVIQQDAAPGTVFPTFANNVGVSSVGISSTGFVFEPATSSVGIGTNNPNYTLDVSGDINTTGAIRVDGRNILDDALIYSIVFG